MKFSVSPFGLYRPGHSAGMPPPISGFDPYSQLYADALLWLQKGWVDFMAPQLYWAVNATHQSYPVLLDWWLKHNPANRCEFDALHAQPTVLYLFETFCLPLLSYSCEALNYSKQQLTQLNVCWSRAYREVFHMNSWESVKELQALCGRLDFRHIYIC